MHAYYEKHVYYIYLQGEGAYLCALEQARSERGEPATWVDCNGASNAQRLAIWDLHVVSIVIYHGVESGTTYLQGADCSRWIR